MNALATTDRPTKLEQVLGEVLPAERRDEFYRVLPRHISPERFERAVANVLMNTPEMLVADPRLIFREISKVVGLGLMLDPQLGEAYLILGWNAKTRQKEPQVRIGYKGLIKLAKQSGEILNIYAREVHEKDEIECLQGDENRLIHKPRLFTDRGPVVGYYAVAKLRNGEIDFEPMSVAQIHEIRDRSDGWKAFRDGKIKSTPWSTDEGEMSKKTVLRRLQKRLTQSPDLVAAVAIEDNAEFSAFDRGRADALPPAAPRRQVRQERPAQVEHRHDDTPPAPPRRPAAAQQQEQAPVEQPEADQPETKDGILEEVDQRLGYARNEEEVEEAYVDTDAEARLSDFEGGVEAARTLKEKHLNRARPQSAQGPVDTTLADDFPANDAIDPARLKPGATMLHGDPFAIPPVLKGGGHYQVFIRDACAAATAPEHDAILRRLWQDTGRVRQDLAAGGQLDAATVKILKDEVMGALARLAGSADDMPPSPQQGQDGDERPAGPAAASEAPQPASGNPVAAYTARLNEALAAAATSEDVERFWQSSTDERDDTGAAEDQRSAWRLARNKRKSELKQAES